MKWSKVKDVITSKQNKQKEDLMVLVMDVDLLCCFFFVIFFFDQIKYEKERRKLSRVEDE